MNLSKKDTALVIGLVGVLFLVLSWFYIASPLKEKTATLETENIQLKATADLYVSINANKEEYENGIVTMEDEIDEMMAHYPSAIARTDEIMFLANMEKSYADDLIVESIAMATPEEVVAVVESEVDTSATDAATGQAQADTAAADAVAAIDGETVDPTYQGELNVTLASPKANMDIHLFKQPVSFTFRCTYSGAKDMITYLFDQVDRKGIDTMNLAFDSETGNLMGTMNLNQYYMVGTGKDYQPLAIPAMNRGVEDVFHTISEGVGVHATVEVAEE